MSEFSAALDELHDAVLGTFGVSVTITRPGARTRTPNAREYQTAESLSVTLSMDPMPTVPRTARLPNNAGLVAVESTYGGRLADLAPTLELPRIGWTAAINGVEYIIVGVGRDPHRPAHEWFTIDVARLDGTKTTGASGGGGG